MSVRVCGRAKKFCVLLFLSGMLAAQTNVGTWKSYTSMRAVRALAVSSNSFPPIVLAATEGGIFQTNTQGAVLARVTNTDGLLSNNTSAVAFDASGGIWVGGVDGSVNYLPSGSSVWRTISAVKNSSYTNKQIQQLYPRGDTVFVVSQFGVSVYRARREEFGDTYANFGFNSTPIVRCVAVGSSSIWVGTNVGIAAAPLSSANLSPPNAWTIFTNANGLPSATISDMEFFHDTLIAATTNGIAYYAGGAFQTVASSIGKAIVDLAASASSLKMLYSSGGIVIESLGGVTSTPQPVAQQNGITGTSMAILDSPGLPQLFVGSGANGIQSWNGTSWSAVIPNAPRSNLFISLAVDRDGLLWCASGNDPNGKGFYRFNPALADSTQWKNFTAADYPVMGSDQYYKASLGVQGSVWMSSWGWGVAEVRNDSVVRRIHTTSTPPLPATVPNSNYIVCGSVQADPGGAQWFVVRTAVDGNLLARLEADNTFTSFQNGYNLTATQFHAMVIDQNGTKWFGNSEPVNKSSLGLYYYNGDLSVSGTEAFNGWGYLSTTDGLPNASVISLAVDLENDVWIGTDLGCTIILNPRAPRAVSSRQSVFALREQSVQTIAVDAVNNKWVGSKEGVFVLNPDGTQLLDQYRVENTGGKLLDNDVRAIAIDQKRGTVYIGTEKGLSSLSIAAVQSQRSFATIDVAPNPFLIPETPQVAILNLVANSSIKILNTNGSLVQQFKAQGGGRAFWDGRDTRGNFVGSGVYLVVAYAENGNQVASGKVAVIRK